MTQTATSQIRFLGLIVIVSGLVSTVCVAAEWKQVFRSGDNEHEEYFKKAISCKTLDLGLWQTEMAERVRSAETAEGVKSGEFESLSKKTVVIQDFENELNRRITALERHKEIATPKSKAINKDGALVMDIWESEMESRLEKIEEVQKRDTPESKACLEHQVDMGALFDEFEVRTRVLELKKKISTPASKAQTPHGRDIGVFMDELDGRIGNLEKQ